MHVTVTQYKEKVTDVEISALLTSKLMNTFSRWSAFRVMTSNLKMVQMALLSTKPWSDIIIISLKLHSCWLIDILHWISDFRLLSKEFHTFCGYRYSSYIGIN